MKTPKFKSLSQTCLYRAKRVQHNCQNKNNITHICKAKNCPLLANNVIMVSKPNKTPYNPLEQEFKPIMRRPEPLLIKTDKGLVELKDWVPLNQGWHGNLGKRRGR